MSHVDITNHVLRVSLAHHDAIVCAGIAALLAESGSIVLVPEGALTQILITDYAEGLARVGAGDDPLLRAKVIIVTHLEREWDVRRAMSARVDGYLLQSSSPEQLHSAITTIGNGYSYLSAELCRYVADSFARSGLTGRETQVLQLLAQGCCNKTIARELGIGIGTVKTHVKGLFEKLGATARTQAVVLAVRRGLVGEYAGANSRIYA